VGLTPEQIKEIYRRKAQAPKRGGRRTKVVDYNDRSYQAWFKLEHTDPEDREFCENAQCLDPQGKRHASPPETAEQVVADVTTEESGTVRMCRFCFTMGWLTKRDNQQQLEV